MTEYEVEVMKYWTQVERGTVSVEAESKEEAEKKAEQLVWEGEFTPDNEEGMDTVVETNVA